MSSRTFYTLVIFDMIFLGLLFLYNTGSNPNPQMQNTINDLFGPWPRLSAPNCQVSWWDIIIPASCTAQTVSSVLIWGFSLLGAFFFKIGAFGTLMLSIFTLTLPSSTSSVPFLNYILIAFQVIIIMDAVTVFRGSSSGV